MSVPAAVLSPRARVKAFVEDQLSRNMGVPAVAEATAAEFARDSEAIAWALRWAAQWLASGLASEARERNVLRLVAEGAPARSVWEGFRAGWLDDWDGGLREIAQMTRPEILDMVEARTSYIAGLARRTRAEKRIAELLPDDKTTPAQFFTTPARQLKLAEVLGDIYGKETPT